MTGREGEQASRGDEFPDALRAAIAGRGLSLDRLRYHLARRGYELSIATLSYWQSGRSRPERASSLAALSALEEILSVPEGSLLRLLPPSRGVIVDGRVLKMSDAEDLLVEDLFAQQGSARDEGYTRISLYERIEIDAEGGLGRRTVREVLRATSDGLTAFPVSARHEAQGGEATLTPLANCTIGQLFRRPHGIAGQIVFERPLRAGEPVIVEYAFDVQGQAPRETSWERQCTGRLREFHVEIRFAEAGRLPLVAEAFSRIGERELVEPLAIVDRRISRLLQDFGPGVYGVRWRW